MNSPVELPQQLFFRVAVRETESWVMSDRKRFARFLGIKEVNMPSNPNELNDPKKFIFEMIGRHSRKKLGRMLPSKYVHIGPDYNSEMCRFIHERWRPEKAIEQLNSMKRTVIL